MQETLRRLGIPFQENVPIRQLTGINQQGVLPLVAMPHTCEQMCQLCVYVTAQRLTYEIIGGATNTYFCEGFMRDIVILTRQLNHITFHADGSFTVGCGYGLSKLSKQMVDRGYAGFEGLAGIPGTIGAAVINNSGAFGCEMKDVVWQCQVLSLKDGAMQTLTKAELDFSPRHSSLKGKKGYCLLSVTFTPPAKSPYTIKELQAIMRRNMEVRRTKIDGKRKSLGTVFVASTMQQLYQRHRFAMLAWKVLNIPNKLFFHRQDWSLFLQFLCLGHPELAKHCDSIGRFCWDKDTTEKDFFNYIDTMQALAGGKLKLEIEIKR